VVRSRLGRGRQPGRGQSWLEVSGWDRQSGDGEMRETQGKGRRQVWMEQHLLRVREIKGWQGASEMHKILIWKVNKTRGVCVGGEGCSRVKEAGIGAEQRREEV